EAVSSAEYETAELNLQAARSRMEEYRYQVESARAILEEARDELSRTLIYAPAGGIISSLDVELGERVVGTSQMAGTEMLRIADYDRMELRVEVSEGDVFRMHHGDSVSIRLDARPDIPLSGRVSRIASAATPSWTTPGTTNFKVRISIDNQHITKLLPGMSATAFIFTCTKYDILTIPLQCIFEKDGRETVWRIDSRMRAHAIPVQCGIRDIYSIEVVSGLDEGDIVAAGPYSIVTRTLCEGDIVYDPHYDE
ncbi:MAG: efflux RND transporter periplasmic adaptor subunit, partial [Bacteroidales bacterium]|nr:efflux RND transporter periplasmic adaptor subunit [Bacteroidales bacterium]